MQDSEQGHIVEVCGDLQVQERTSGVNRICDGAPCGFSDAKSSPKEAKERSDSMRKLLIAVVLCIIFMTIEIVGGIRANSLAILTDAAHLLSDVAAFAFPLFSLCASGWEATPRQSYGFFRIERVGALFSIQMIWVLSAILVYEAISRFFHETGEVQGFLMFLISAFGLVVNIIMVVLLGHDRNHGQGHGDDHGHNHGHDHGHNHGHDHGDANKHNHENSDDIHTHGVTIKTQVVNKTGHSKHDKHHHHAHDTDHTVPLLGPSSESEGEHYKQRKQRNLNVQGAYLHVLGDSIQSIGVMIGGAIIWYKPEWKVIDLICTLVLSLIVVGTSINMLGNIWEVLIGNTPREIDATSLEEGLCEMEEAVAIQELHIWAITVGKVVLACRVKVKPEADADMVLDKVVDYVKKDYNINHVIIQIEREPHT